MSAVLAPRPDEEAGSQLRLQAVAAEPSRMPQLPFVVVLLTFLGVGMAGVLLLATSLQSQTNELNDLQRQAASLRYEQAALESQVEDARSTQQLASRAWELGMRPNPHPILIVLPEGTVLGQPQEAPDNGLPDMAPRPQLKPEFKPPVGVADQPPTPQRAVEPTIESPAAQPTPAADQQAQPAATDHVPADATSAEHPAQGG